MAFGVLPPRHRRTNPMHAPALFLVPYPTDAGYAIDALCQMFFRAATRLNDGDESRVHLAFRATTGALTKGLPKTFSNYLEFDAEKCTVEQARQLSKYIRQNGIRFVMLLDVQPVAPLVAILRGMGVTTIITYWGAPISGRHSGPRLLFKRAGIWLGGARRVNSAIFESRAMANLAIYGRGCPRSMLDVVNLGTDVERFRPAATKAHTQAEFGIGPEKTIVLFSGHTHERKGMPTLMDAAAVLYRDHGRRDIVFLICGNRRDEGESWLQRVRGTGAEESIVFAGYRSDMPDIMSACDIGVIPSSGWDSFTVSSLEMAASRLPVIVSRLGGLPESIVDGKTGLVFEPGDARALAECIARLADNPEERLRLGTAGRVRVEKDFTLEAQCTRLVEVFERRIREATLSE